MMNALPLVLTLSDPPVSPPPKPVLTERERQVATLTAKGLTSQEIGERLTITFKTVKSHRTHIYRKLGFRGAVELTAYVIRQGWMAP